MRLYCKEIKEDNTSRHKPIIADKRQGNKREIDPRYLTLLSIGVCIATRSYDIR
jgi:uncharacterized OsmC-like protein